MILAGDIGGTKCNLAIFQEGDGVTLLPVFQRRYATRDFSRFEDVIAHFRRQAVEQGIDSAGEPINAAGFGVAGAVVDGRLHANNLPWDLNPLELARELGVNFENIVLLNDVVATAWSLDRLPAKDLAVLNQGVLQPTPYSFEEKTVSGLLRGRSFWARHSRYPRISGSCSPSSFVRWIRHRSGSRNQREGVHAFLPGLRCDPGPVDRSLRL